MIADFVSQLASRFSGAMLEVAQPRGETGLVVAPSDWLETCRALRDEFGFDTFIDLCGVDYLSYGNDEWDTEGVSAEGFSRGVEGQGPGRFKWGEQPSHQVAEPGSVTLDELASKRYAVVLHLLSVQHNQRIRVSCFAADNSLPVVASITSVWPGVNWFERETFDLFGIIFEGHPDLRRILTDYGFVGHPFRKDFPLIGNVEVRYDAEKQRVVYEPVTSVEPRVGVPRVIRNDAGLRTAKGERDNRILDREASR
ncbi:NADH-quinone oxidoreductase subunit C [Thermomonas sp.]|uniref:NADH-quinone oxidoreductase subunit C n=1 Tax=Thermomonas sp. TaxID=1971895 RepID=UPI0024887B1E|nr:NADH-quinone oxidoreductase subunit C [Thermomonas sp.]MDI1253125.1 NADH-quinone oxidoreductase subunit C [Thermomonas sp.]